MTALEAYELTTQGGGTDFARLVDACESLGPYCVIGGLAVNCYVEAVYSLDADIVVRPESLAPIGRSLQSQAPVHPTAQGQHAVAQVVLKAIPSNPTGG